MRGIQLSLLDRLVRPKRGVSPFRRFRRVIASQLDLPSTPSKRKPPKRAGPKSDPQLQEIWSELREEYFPERLDLEEYTVYWSRRNQKRTLASCNLELKRISVARELNHPKHLEWLRPLIYHEMCHAFLHYNVSRKGRRLAWHGKEFRALEAKHPGTKALDAWIESGGWATAVRSHRARMSHQMRKQKQV